MQRVRRSGQHLRPAERRRLEREIHTGKSYYAIARKLGVAPSAVSATARRMGHPPKPPGGQRTTSLHRPAVFALLQQGLTRRQAMARLGIPWALRDAFDNGSFPRVGGLCTWCSRPATLWHHVTYVPEQVYPACASCHSWLHWQMRRARQRAAA